jgi:uncharacterized protein YbbC (DUF1343 family)
MKERGGTAFCFFAPYSLNMLQRALLTAFLAIFLLVAPFRMLAAEALLYGIDVLASSGCEALSGKRAGLITNSAGLSATREPNYRVLQRHGVDLRFLMAPEHGFSMRTAAGETVGNLTLSDTLKVYSLYGASKKPDSRLLKSIDVLIFDLQDVGTRCYTYISTMRYAMEACSDAGVAFMVLDRPNPVAPLSASGFMLDPRFRSFVGSSEIPFLHGMTVGEIASWLQKQHYPGLSLTVVRMKGYDRKRFADQHAGFRFLSPSPNIRDMETVLAYPATVFLEATEVSEGRGTDAPFRMFGAPFVDGSRLKKELDSRHLPGVVFRRVRFRPGSGKHADSICHGVRMTITDRKAYDPFRTSAAIMLAMQKLCPAQFGLEKRSLFFDRLAGTDRYRIMVEQQRPLGEILAAAREAVRIFELHFPDRFLYP